MTEQTIATGDITHDIARPSWTGVRITVWDGSPTIILGTHRFRADTVYASQNGTPVSATLTRITKSGQDHKRARHGGYIRLDDLDQTDADALRAVAAPAIAAADPTDLPAGMRASAAV